MVGCDAVRVDMPVDLSERSAAVPYELFVLGRVALIDFLCVMCIGCCGSASGFWCRDLYWAIRDETDRRGEERARRRGY